VSRCKLLLSKAEHTENNCDILGDSVSDVSLQQVGQVRQEGREKEAQVKEKEQFYETEVSNNKEVEKKIEMTDRMYAKLKQELQDAEKLRDTFNSEVSISTITSLLEQYVNSLLEWVFCPSLLC